MRARIQRSVMMSLLIAAGMGASACLPPPGQACGGGWCPEGYRCESRDSFTCVTNGCGNSDLEGDEECDDGNFLNGDGCDSNCTVTACGNRVQTTGEECDDGNVVNDDGCDSNCTMTDCGNGVVAAGEECDDDNDTNGDGCDSNCTMTACGNGVVTAGEGCEDGNALDGDGCDNNCTVTACGNGVVVAGEMCDDGNIFDGDGCDSNCTVTACGNGIVTMGEECDDGNDSNADFCDNNCTANSCVPLDTSTFAGLKAGGCLQGGIATDATGVSTPRNPNGNPADPLAFTMAGKPLTVQIPATATIRKAYLTLIAKYAGGFNINRPANGDPAAQVKLNGILLTNAGPPVDQNAPIPAGPGHSIEIPAGRGYRVYDVTNWFGINLNGPGEYSYEERGDADARYIEDLAPGMAAAQLVVVFDDSQHTQVRHVSYKPQFLFTETPTDKFFDVTGLPKCGGAPTSAPTNAVISFGVAFECSSEQTGQLHFKPGSSTTYTELTKRLGGRDDGTPGLVEPSCIGQDYNSMFSAGSFGYNNAGALVGVAGDSPTSEPINGTSQNSRLSDELFETGPLDLSGLLNVKFRDNSPNEILTGMVVAIDLSDPDCDGIPDAADNCLVTPNTDQADSDGDGFGDACDPPACSNGVPEAGEGCDDGNTAPGDGCNAVCLIENGNACNAAPIGNTGSTSCASGLCDITGGLPGVCEPANSCGNGVLEAGENCDDGNTTPGDGCNAMCLVESVLPGAS